MSHAILNFLIRILVVNLSCGSCQKLTL
jgi:hypothetical protein